MISEESEAEQIKFVSEVYKKYTTDQKKTLVANFSTDKKVTDQLLSEFKDCVETIGKVIAEELKKDKQ
jgi:transaldolase